MPAKNTPNALKCSHCGRKGHSDNKCWKKHSEKRPNKAKIAYTRPGDEFSLNSIEEIALYTPNTGSKNSWILDSAATSHISAYRDLFTEIRPCSIKLNWGTAKALEIKEIGTISLRLKDGRNIKLSDCLYCPKLGVNLLSTGKIIAKGLTINLTRKECQIVAKDEIIGIGTYKNDLTIFQAYKHPEQAYASTTAASNANIWHHRMGHIGVKALEQLSKATKGSTDINSQDLANYKEDACDTCIQAKQTAKISRETSEPTEKYLDKIYSDICGPVSPQTPSHYRYYASIIDDATRWATICLMQTRDQLIKSIINWQIAEERQTELKLKRFHSDNALEYKALGDILAEKGVNTTYSTPYSPQQNGHAERFNLTIFSKIRALFITLNPASK